LKVKTGESKSIEWNGLHIHLERPAFDIEEKSVSQKNTELLNINYYDLGSLTGAALHRKRRVSPSRLQHENDEDGSMVKVTVLDYKGEQLSVGRDEELSYDETGSILHAAFAAWNSESPEQIRQAVLTQVLTNFHAEKMITPSSLEAQFCDFWNYIQKTYKPIRFWKEIPLQSVAENNGELMSGFADLVLDTPQGLILIDHKTFPGSFEKQVMDPASAFYAGKYAAQLKAYAKLVSNTFGKPVTEMLIHYVVHGKLVRLSAPSFASSAVK
jgi:ATP-dependent exoDNAse (exonuclease V) beta subunit